MPSPDRRSRRRANSDTPAPPLASSIPEWRKEGLGQEMLAALERIERDSPPPPPPPAKRKPRTLGSLLSGLVLARRRSGLRRRAASHEQLNKDGRKAEKRREAERALPEVGIQISAPFEVSHSLYLQTPRGEEALLGAVRPERSRSG